MSAIAAGTPPGPDPGPGARGPDRVGHRRRPSFEPVEAHPPDPARRDRRSRPAVGSVSGPSHSRRSADGAREPLDLGHEHLALTVLLHLEVQPGDPQHGALERRALLAPAVEPRGDPLDARDEVLAHLVHHVVAEPLEQRS